MKFPFLLTFVLLLIINIYAQESNNDCAVIKESADYYCDGRYKKSAKILEKSYTSEFEQIDSSKNILMAIAKSYYLSGNLKKAKYYYESLVEVTNYPFSEVIPGYTACLTTNISCSGFILPNRLLENQHEACVKLAEIGFKTKDLEYAFTQIQNADLYYRFWYGCGTGDLENDLKLSLMYAKYYTKKDMPDTAIKSLLKNILEPAAMPVPYYSDVVEQTSDLLKKQYSLEKRQLMLDTAIDNLYFKSFGFDQHNHENRTYFIKFLDVEIKVAPEYLFNHNTNLDEIKEYLRKTDFYQKSTEK